MSHTKQAGTQAGHHALPAVIRDGEVEAGTIPHPPTRLPHHLVLAWRGFWGSPMARLVHPVMDLPVVVRLWRLYAVDEKLDELLHRSLDFAMEEGEPGDLCEHHPREVNAPLVGARVRVATEIRNLEDRLGLSPRSRLALGLAMLAGSRAGGPGAMSLEDATEESNQDD